MTFRKINEAEASHDSGYRIRIGYSRLTYIEGGIAVSLDCEHMADGSLAIYGFSVGSELDPAAQDRVLGNVRQALAFLNVPFDIQLGD
jgi:hypothetical protein